MDDCQSGNETASVESIAFGDLDIEKKLRHAAVQLQEFPMLQFTIIEAVSEIARLRGEATSHHAAVVHHQYVTQRLANIVDAAIARGSWIGMDPGAEGTPVDSSEAEQREAQPN